MSTISRRTMLLGTAGGILTIGGLAACRTSSGSSLAPTSEAVRRAERARQAVGQRTVTALLSAAPATLDLGGRASVPGHMATACRGRCCEPRQGTGCKWSSTTRCRTPRACTGTALPCATTWTASQG